MFQIRQSFVDLFVAVAFADQAFQFDAPELRHLKDFLDIVGLSARHTRDRDLACDEVAAADRERPAAETADDRRRTAGPGGLNDLVGGLGIADRFEGFIDAALGEPNHRLNRILRARVDRVRRAELPGGFQFVVSDIDSDNRIGAEAFKKLNRVEPDTAAADY